MGGTVRTRLNINWVVIYTTCSYLFHLLKRAQAVLGKCHYFFFFLQKKPQNNCQAYKYLHFQSEQISILKFRLLI